MTARARRVIRAGDDPVSAWRAIGEVPAILEALRRLRARDVGDPRPRRATARLRAFDVAENHHEGGILADDQGAGGASGGDRRGSRRRRRSESPTRSAMSAYLAVEMFVVPADGEQRPAGQRDRPARPQFRPLDRGRLPLLAVRAAHSRHRRLAARRPASAIRRGDDQPDRRHGRRRGGRLPRNPTPGSISTARTRSAPAAKWAMSTGSRRDPPIESAATHAVARRFEIRRP